jgi:hypothetical protein
MLQQPHRDRRDTSGAEVEIAQDRLCRGDIEFADELACVDLV